MHTYYVIADKTANTGRNYIADDHSNTGDETSAKMFRSKESAQDYIRENGWKDWAYVTTVELPYEIDL